MNCEIASIPLIYFLIGWVYGMFRLIKTKETQELDFLGRVLFVQILTIMWLPLVIWEIFELIDKGVSKCKQILTNRP